MGYELVVKQKRITFEEKVTISSNGRLFYLSWAVMKKYFVDAPYVQIYLDRDEEGNSIRIGLRPTKRAEENSFSIIRPKKGLSAMVTARPVLSEIGYKNNQRYRRDANWNERNIGGRKVGLLEFEIEKKYCNQKKVG